MYLRLSSYANTSLNYIVARTGKVPIVELKIHIRETDALKPYLRLSSDAEKFLRYLVGGTESLNVIPGIHILTCLWSILQQSEISSL